MGLGFAGGYGLAVLGSFGLVMDNTHGGGELVFGERKHCGFGLIVGQR